MKDNPFPIHPSEGPSKGIRYEMWERARLHDEAHALTDGGLQDLINDLANVADPEGRA
jgi:hypothetical protein